MVTIALAVGTLGASAPASAATGTFHQCQTTDIPVIDFGTQGLGAFVTVPKNAARGQRGAVKQVSAGVRVTHGTDQDLLLSLISPSGQAIALATARGAAGDGYGSGAAGCTGALAAFDDAATTPIATPGNVGDAPVVGSFRPEQPFSSFLGGPAAGTWMLVMTDRLAGDTGSIRAFDLAVTYSYKKAKKKHKK